MTSLRRRVAPSLGIWLIVAAVVLIEQRWALVGRVTFNLIMMTSITVGGVLCGVRAWRSAGRARRVWGNGFVAMVAWFISRLPVGITDLEVKPAAQWPLYALLGSLTAFVFAIRAMLAASTAPKSWPLRTRMLLDGGTVAVSLFGFAWIVVLSPLSQRVGSIGAALMELSYPITAVGVLAVALLLLVGQRPWRRSALAFITGGVAAISATLLVEVYANSSGSTWLRPWLDGGLLLSAMLIAYSPLVPLPPPDSVWEGSTVDAKVLPYIPVGLFVLALSAVSLRGGKIELPVIAAAVLSVGCVFGRQFLTIQLNASLTRDLEIERERLAHEAFHDRLTALPNRAMLNDRLRNLKGAPGEDAPALLMIDLDGFKAVNDTLGHPTGDELLAVVGERLRSITREPLGVSVLAARLGGDEFAILTSGGGAAVATRIADLVLVALARPIALADRTIAVRASVGVALLHSGAAQHLMRQADVALYAAKDAGKGCYRMFDPAMSVDAVRRLQLQSELAEAIARGQLEVAYQPIVDIRTAGVTGVEALIRWRHPERGLLSPDAFLPAAQTMGLLVEFDRWILNEACGQVARWRERAPQLTASVNVSSGYLTSGHLIADVAHTLASTGLPGPALTVEVTEHALVADLDAASRVLHSLRKLGVRVALDDFGVGYSSLNYLRKLPVDVVKIDRSFVQDLTDAEADTTLVDTILALAQNLRLDSVAEGVEDAVQADRLQQMRCYRAQGYYFAKPMPAAQVVELLTEQGQPAAV